VVSIEESGGVGIGNPDKATDPMYSQGA